MKTSTDAVCQRECCCSWCVAAHQPAGVQAAEAQNLYQTINPTAEAISSVTESQASAPLSKTSSWNGLVDDAGVRSLAGNSSEISEEHVVMHLRRDEEWDEKQNPHISSQPSQEDSDNPKNSNAMGLSQLESLESQGGSAHEEEDSTSFGPDSSTLSYIASSSPQPQTSNSVLAEFVNTLIRPFRYWTGSQDAEETEKGLSVPENKAGENQTHEEASLRNPNVPKASGNKGSLDNAIMEHRSGRFSLSAPTSGLHSPEEGLSEQEKEVMPLIRLVPAVQHTEQSDTSEGASSTSADNSLSTVNSKSRALIIFTFHL